AGSIEPSQPRNRRSGADHVRHGAVRGDRESSEFRSVVVTHFLGDRQRFSGGLQSAQIEALSEQVAIAVEEQVSGLHVCRIRLLRSNESLLLAVQRPGEDASGGALRAGGL